MDKILQTGLAAGMSATAGIHRFTGKKPERPDRQFDGKNIMPPSFCPDARARVRIPTKAGPPVEASYLCVGGWSWGDTSSWHWKEEEELPAVKEAWRELYAAGVNFIDTAEAYGDGRSEEITGELIRSVPARESVVVQTKWLGLPLAPTNIAHAADAPLVALKASLKRLGTDYVDILLVHGHIHRQSVATVAEGLARVVDQGLARAVGVANYDIDDFVKMRDELAKHGVPLNVNQCEYSVLRRLPEIEGDMARYKDMEVVFQSYSSLAQGRLAGKYSVDDPPPASHRFSNYDMKDVQPAIDVLRQIATERGKSVAAVALNYNISKGALPLVGIRNPVMARENLQALGWRLDPEEVRRIDENSFLGSRTRLWQQG
ncbi:NADP-dependent oxidoreductase domain-containing protein [Xylariaceae sp. FL0594]|nr:NADP-dependent oxidoreductase domain-containing protein [Xylariaceae sp. FL0594]